MSDKIIRYPFRVEAAKRKDRKKPRVPCEVSQRWLQFHQIDHHENEDYIHVDVMTGVPGEHERKICELVLTKDDLSSVLADLPVKDRTKE